jgi:energy-coupling factor transporter ATP-binding protein EcfA2
MSISVNRLRDAVTIENHNLEDGRLPENITEQLLKKWEENLKREKNPDYKGSQNVAVAPVVISPFHIVPSFEHGEKHKNRNPMPVYPLWIPAMLNREGKLTPPSEAKPWILRSVLEPLQRIRVSVVLSSVEKVDEFLTHSEVPKDSWKDYWDYCRLFFKEVTGKHWGDIKEQNFVSTNNNHLLVDTSYNFATAALLNLYDYLRDESDLPKLFSKYISFSGPPLQPLLDKSQMESASRRHVGHMGNQFPLSASQRQVLYHFFTLKDGEVLAVTGPPGTGKTTLIQNVVATLLVERALEGKEPPIIVAASNNNQAVTNVLETFCEAQNGLGKLSGRWLPKIGSFGAHLPSRKHGLTANPPCISLLGEGLPSFIENKEYFDVAKEHYLEKCKEFSGKDFTTPKSAVEWLRDQLREEFQNIIFGLESWEKYQDFDKKLIKHRGLAGLEQEISESELEFKQIITHEEIVQSIRSDLLAADKAESIWSKIFSFVSAVKKQRSAKYKMIFSDFPFSTQNLNWLSLVDLYECVDEAIKELKNQKKNIQEKIKHHELMHEGYKKAIENWEAWKSKFGFKNNPPHIHDELDITLRHRAFLLATHYWEGRWLLECQKLLIVGDEGHALKKHKDKWHRYAMLTPCFVSTLYSLPKFFSYPIPAGNNDGYITIPNLEFIDLLIIEEAGQVSPEIGAPAFALAKKALVLGDVYQIEPVWSIPPSVDAGNLEKSAVIEDQGNPDQLLKVEKRGLSTSKSSVMKAAQEASYYQLKELKERGLYLTEHRRCDPEIISYCNELAYQGTLIPMRPAPEKRIFPPFGYAHIHGISFKRGGLVVTPLNS